MDSLLLSLSKNKEINQELDFAVIADGVALQLILNDEFAKKCFVMLTAVAKSVIVSRVAPSQKVLLVKLVKNCYAFKPVTLAIGDGCGDVGMIHESHVGVGMMGHEGLQAANAADFAISKFKQLENLLLVHGRRNYRRSSLIILYNFYKNLLLMLPLFYFMW